MCRKGGEVKPRPFLFHTKAQTEIHYMNHEKINNRVIRKKAAIAEILKDATKEATMYAMRQALAKTNKYLAPISQVKCVLSPDKSYTIDSLLRILYLADMDLKIIKKFSHEDEPAEPIN